MKSSASPYRKEQGMSSRFVGKGEERQRNERSRWNRSRTRSAYIFLSPWFFSLVVFWYGPIIYTIVLSFMRYRFIGGGSFVGFGNYIKIFQDEFFWIGLTNTVSYISMYVPGMFVMSLFTAYLISMNVKFKSLWRSLLYVPSVIPVIAVLVLGKFIFFPQGLVNMALGLFGIQGPLWLSNPMLIRPAAVLIMLWRCGEGMVVYLAALQGVPSMYYEVADIDGLSKPKQFFRITLPLISPTIFFRVIVDTIVGLMVFIPGLVLPAGNVPGGPGTSSRFYALHLYEKAFQRFNLGEAAALATVLILISFALTVIIMRGSKRFVYYEV